ncbi:MAG: hypothetical protein BWX86_01741 [Verrucomicrobia bacterium ADurb.Bin122]|nr:MAG: hypothetical protein BWX86_01741 [Verrucomicrobia bacterium ADurb.Bin122]
MHRPALAKQPRLLLAQLALLAQQHRAQHSRQLGPPLGDALTEDRVQSLRRPRAKPPVARRLPHLSQHSPAVEAEVHTGIRQKPLKRARRRRVGDAFPHAARFQDRRAQRHRLPLRQPQLEIESLARQLAQMRIGADDHRQPRDALRRGLLENAFHLDLQSHLAWRQARPLWQRSPVQRVARQPGADHTQPERPRPQPSRPVGRKHREPDQRRRGAERERQIHRRQPATSADQADGEGRGEPQQGGAMSEASEGHGWWPHSGARGLSVQS